ncbi:MAG: hypothetical protein M3Q81_04235 [bacterium]|nr:hypothetical protein [bacterium]
MKFEDFIGQQLTDERGNTHFMWRDAIVASYFAHIAFKGEIELKLLTGFTNELLTYSHSGPLAVLYDEAKVPQLFWSSEVFTVQAATNGLTLHGELIVEVYPNLQFVMGHVSDFQLRRKVNRKQQIAKELLLHMTQSTWDKDVVRHLFTEQVASYR